MKVICYAATFFLTTSFCVASQNSYDTKKIRPLVTLSGGEVFSSHVGQSQTFPEIEGSFYSYSANNANQSRGLYGSFIGAEWGFNPCWALQFGVGYYQASAFTARGLLTQGPDAGSSDIYNYQYNITSRQLLAESKLLFNWHERYHPYALMGLGEAFNKASSYQTTVPPFLTFTPMFNSHTTKSFTYAVGLGLDVDVVRHVRAGLGYRFTDLGKVNLGAGSIDTTSIGNSLTQNHMCANEVLAQLTFIL